MMRKKKVAYANNSRLPRIDKPIERSFKEWECDCLACAWWSWEWEC